MDSVGPTGDDEQLPPYELSQAAFDAKTEEAVQRSLQSSPSPPRAEHVFVQGDAQFPVIPPPQPVPMAPQPLSPLAGPSSSMPPPAPSGARARPRRPPLPPIPTVWQHTKINTRPINPRSCAHESIPRKEAERFMHDAPSWTAPLVVENEPRLSSVQSVYNPSPTPSSSRYSHLDSVIESEGFNDDGEAPPPFMVIGPRHHTPPLPELVSQFQGMHLQSEAAEQVHDRSSVHSPESIQSPLPASPHSTISSPEDMGNPSEPSQYRRHRLSLPNPTRQPNPVPETAARSSTIFMDEPRVLPPPTLFNAIAYAQGSAPAILGGVTTQEGEVAAPGDFYNAAVSSTMITGGIRRPPKRPRTSKFAPSSELGVETSSSYFSSSGSRILASRASTRSASPTVSHRPLSPHDALGSPISFDTRSYISSSHLPSTSNSSDEHTRPYSQSFSVPLSSQTYDADRYSVSSDRVSFRHPLLPPLPPPPPLPMRVHPTATHQWGPTHQRQPSSRPPNPMY